MVGYVVAQDDAVVIVFRGTDMHEWSDWGVNKSIRSARTEHGEIHSGFDQAYEKLAPQVEKLLSQLKPKYLWVTGHSLGGALATVCAYRIESQGDHRVQGLVTFGQPMVARLDLAEHLDAVFKDRYAWIVNGNDMIPKTPPRYEPAGRLVHLNGTKSPGYWRRGEVFATAMPGDDEPPRASLQAPPLPPLTPDERELLKNQLRKEPPPMFETETLAYTSYVPEVSDHFMDAYLLSLRDLLGVNAE
jgi:pimeloyl-ACP methyl ester carboxylesterase